MVLTAVLNNKEVLDGSDCSPCGNDSRSGRCFLPCEVERVQAQVKIVRPDGAVSQRQRLFPPTGKRCLSREV